MWAKIIDSKYSLPIGSSYAHLLLHPTLRSLSFSALCSAPLHSVSMNADEFFTHTRTYIFHTAEILRYQSNDLVVSIACQALITICFMVYYFHAFEMRVFRYIIIARTTTTTTRHLKISFCCRCRHWRRCCSCVYIYSTAEISLHSITMWTGGK